MEIPDVDRVFMKISHCDRWCGMAVNLYKLLVFFLLVVTSLQRYYRLDHSVDENSHSGTARTRRFMKPSRPARRVFNAKFPSCTLPLLARVRPWGRSDYIIATGSEFPSFVSAADDTSLDQYNTILGCRVFNWDSPTVVVVLLQHNVVLHGSGSIMIDITTKRIPFDVWRTFNMQ